MKNIAIFGSSGMAGHMISLYLKQTHKYNIINISRDENNCDVFFDVLYHIDNIKKIIQENNINIIINCIGILPNKIEENISNSIYINSYFPQILENITKDTSVRIIHLSTDCVFSGNRGDYDENDIPDGNSYYSRTKHMGEINNNKDLTIRLSIIGPEIRNKNRGLFNWFMNQNNSIKGFTNVYWSGITTLDLSIIIEQIIESSISGLYHITSGIKISKFKLLDIIKNIFDKDIEIIPLDKPVFDKTLKTIRNEIEYNPISYEVMIDELKVWMINNKYL